MTTNTAGMKIIITGVLLFLMSASVMARMHKEVVEYKDGDTSLKGFLFWEDSFEGKRPGVLVVHEWWGLNDYALLRAEMLAENGYVAFAADMYGEGRITRHAEDAKGWMKQITGNVDDWQRRAVLGLKQLTAHDKVDTEKTAAIGYCFGGATVMQLAYTGAEVDAVVSFHGSLPPASAEQAAKVKAKVLLAHGAADGFIPKERVAAFSKALSDAGVDWEMDIYGGAVHGFTNPYADGYGVKGVAYNESADRRSWQRLLNFFESLFEEEI